MNLLSRSLTSKFPSGFLKSPNFLTLVFPYSSCNAQQSQEQVEEEEEEYPQRKLPADYDPSNFDPAEHRSPPSDRVFRLVDEIASLSLMEVSQLSGIMRKKLGMKEMPSIAVMKPGMGVMSGTRGEGAAPAAAVEEKKEKTVFEVKLEGYDASAKIKIIKEVRGFTDLGLKEAKDLVEKAPTVVKTGVSKEEGEKIVEKLKALGAKVVME